MTHSQMLLLLSALADDYDEVGYPGIAQAMRQDIDRLRDEGEPTRPVFRSCRPQTVH